jgi:hypothetical protein
MSFNSGLQSRGFAVGAKMRIQEKTSCRVGVAKETEFLK